MIDHKKEDDINKRKKRIKDMLFHLHVSRLQAYVVVCAAMTEPKLLPKRPEKVQVNAAERLKQIRNRLDKSRRKADE